MAKTNHVTLVRANQNHSNYGTLESSQDSSQILNNDFHRPRRFVDTCGRVCFYTASLILIVGLLGIAVYEALILYKYNLLFAKSYNGHFSYGNCSQYKCGLSPLISSRNLLRIVGGQVAQPYSWPWQAALLIQKNDGYFKFHCGATLISNQYVLTSAHCLINDSQVQHYKIKLGTFNELSTNEPGEAVMGIQQILIDPRFDKQLLYYDVALLKLISPVICNDHILPVCLPRPEENLPPVKSSLTIVGWGTKRKDGPPNYLLQAANVPLISEDTCQSVYGIIINYLYNFCAGYKNGGTDTCQGDSGGPIMYRSNEHSQWVQIGLTSWGDGCGEPRKPGVYTSLSTSLDWIKSNVDVSYKEG